ncbi:TetR/AcrR family transcriptional regulator [uncultured Cellulomonas sp.]|uniref:TetR/AcrR family transcriptional regulator n=1 Tax=uncultured Cellulomonas sp. TaxID=189682 RepID=UPI002608DBEE|nr:TetR/AcrR family transcriptional regulator [uncultured Cellulomonas sp.]
MPAPERTTTHEVVRAGRDLLEAHGPAGVTMAAVAARVGVRPPSLYKRVRNRDDLLRLVTEAAVGDLADQLAAVARSGDPRHDLRRIARALRAFAHASPVAYGLVFTPGPAATRPDPALLARASEPVLRATAELAGPDDALVAARTVTAWAHGFLSMELSGAFTLGGEVDQAFDHGLTRVVDALVAR